jgi:hypothetical protein
MSKPLGRVGENGPLERRLEGPVFLAGVAILTLMFLAVAIWNGFPLVFYDTGAYLVEGLRGAFLVERSPVYSLLLLLAGGRISLWLIVILQAVMTAYVVGEAARIEVPRLSLKGLCGIGLGVMLLTGIGWYVGQVEPDCFTALVTLGSYLLLFRGAALGRNRSLLVGAITGLSVACHPSHLGLIGGLIICGGLLKAAIYFFPLRPSHPSGATGTSSASASRAGEAGLFLGLRLLPAIGALLLALALILASNLALAHSIFISRSGSVFVFARLMQDGIVKKLMDDTCPPPDSHQTPPYKLCNFRNKLKTRADAWLWGPDSAFHAQGGFANSQEEDSRIIRDSLIRYPWLHVKAALSDSVQQFFEFKTGDGIESQEWVLKPGFQRMLPAQLQAYLAARQQNGRISFRFLNILHVTIGMLSLLGLLMLLYRAGWTRRWDEGLLPALVLLALVGNAIICGTFSNPHDRYQSRLIWVPTLVLLLAWSRNHKVLAPVEESGI